MQDDEQSDFQYFRENGPRIVATGLLMGWVQMPKAQTISNGVGQTPQQALAARLKTQRCCMAVLREKRKQTKTKEKQWQ